MVKSNLPDLWSQNDFLFRVEGSKCHSDVEPLVEVKDIFLGVECVIDSLHDGVVLSFALDFKLLESEGDHEDNQEQ